MHLGGDGGACCADAVAAKGVLDGRAAPEPPTPHSPPHPPTPRAASPAGRSALDDLISGGEESVQEAEFDDDTWLHAARAAPKPRAAPQPAPPSPAANEPRSAEAMSLDAISRALKAGVDKETLKRYIDEVAETVADSAGVRLPHACACVLPRPSYTSAHAQAVLPRFAAAALCHKPSAAPCRALLRSAARRAL
jgi:hypothetical protein